MQITSGNATIGPVTLNGGTMDSSSAASITAQYGAYEFSGAITVGGTTPSTIQSEVSAIYNLTVNSFAPNGIFNVTNVNGLLNVTAALGNSGGSQTAAGLLKTGPGTLALYAANLYTGSTTVSNGTLLVANTNGNTGSISNGPVYIAGGTLGGNGVIYGAVTNQAGGTLKPGAGTTSPGTVLTLNSNLTLLAGSTTVLQVEHNTTPDQVTSGGIITYGGILTVVTNAQDSTAFQVGDTFTLFNKAGAGAYKAGSSFATIQPPPGPGLGWSGANLTVNGSIQVVAASPVSASFSWGPASGAQPLTVNFTNLSSGATYWIWNYGDNNTLTTFGGTNVSHVYPNVGSYTVSLTAYGPGGVSWVTNIAAVVVLPPPPVAAFSASPTNVFLTQAVTFTDASTGSITNWVWSLGNNTFVTNSSNASVVHTYAATGTYTVSLKVSGAGGATPHPHELCGRGAKTSLGAAAAVNGKLVFSGANGPAGQQYRIQHITAGKELGSDDYLVKPYEPEMLISTIKGKLKRSRQLNDSMSQQMDSLKNQLFRLISHEMRTPLTSILGAAEILSGGKETLSPEDFTEFLQMLKIGTLRLNRMVEDFLLVIKIESGEVSKEIDFNGACIVPLEIATRFASVLEEIKKNKDITLNIEVSDESPYLFIHPPHFEDIVARLFDNACKFSPPGAAITIASHSENDRYIFSVADNGNGIPLEKQDRLFQKFYQVDRESHEQQGAGLGLYIAKKLAELNKCTLWCESDRGKGAAFYLSIPKKV